MNYIDSYNVLPEAKFIINLFIIEKIWFFDLLIDFLFCTTCILNKIMKHQIKKKIHILFFYFNLYLYIYYKKLIK